MVTPALFAKYPDARTGLAARCSLPKVERLVQPTGFFRAEETKAIIGMAHVLFVGRSMGARFRPTWTRSSRCQVSAARRRTSSLGLRLECRDCPSTSCAPRGEPDRHRGRGTIRSSSNSSCARRCRRRGGRAPQTPSILHGRRICGPSRFATSVPCGEGAYYTGTVIAPRRRTACRRTARHHAQDEEGCVRAIPARPPRTRSRQR